MPEGCIANGSLILMIDGTFAKIEELEVGVQIIGARLPRELAVSVAGSVTADPVSIGQPSGRFVGGAVTGLARITTRSEFYCVNDELLITKDHPVLAVRDGKWLWLNVDALVLGDNIRSLKGYTEVKQLDRKTTDAESVLVKTTCRNVIIRGKSNSYVVRAGYAKAGSGLQRSPGRHFSVNIVQRFFDIFAAATGLPSDLPVATDQGIIPLLLGDNSANSVYCRKEPIEQPLVAGKHVHILIDCLDDDSAYVTYDRRFYVAWAAISFFSRKGQEARDLLRPTRQFITKEKTEFCDFLFTPGGGEKIVRQQFYETLSSRRPVVVPPSTWRRHSSYQYDEAVTIHAPFRFNIAFENSSKPGWVTEKILNAFLAGCIPIYWGTEDVRKYFNQSAFIDARDFRDLPELADYVIQVDDSPALREKYLDEPICHPWQLERLFWWQ